jgi:hypothetical protein
LEPVAAAPRGLPEAAREPALVVVVDLVGIRDFFR